MKRLHVRNGRWTNPIIFYPNEQRVEAETPSQTERIMQINVK